MGINKILLISMLQCFAFGFCQNVKPIALNVSKFHTQKKHFEKYNLFEVNTTSNKMIEYKSAATDITVLNLKADELQKIIKGKPEFIEMSFPFDGDKKITVELYKNQISTNDFKVTTSEGQAVNYTPGVYYQGIIKGDNSSVVAFSFFDNDVVGIASTSALGNVVLGKAKNSNDFVSYSDAKLTGTNPFICGVDELKENQSQKIAFDPNITKKTTTDNCVRIYYELCHVVYENNGSDIATTTNWMTAVHNNVATLYTNDGIRIALSEIFIWDTPDPFTGGFPINYSKFTQYRTSFNGDLGVLVNSPGGTSVATLNSLCGNRNTAYVANQHDFENVPVYSWTVSNTAHEIGHGLGSPHTHVCIWNGNHTAIDTCGGDFGCGGHIPSPSEKGTIMSYCHLISGVGISFSNGFGPQPAALMRNVIASKACLSTNCITSCDLTITNLEISNITHNEAHFTLANPTSELWRYEVETLDGVTITSGNSNAETIDVSNLQSNTYYKVSIWTDCSAAPQASKIFLTDADWCGGALFTDTGGETGNYGNNEIIVKTFYPTSGKLTMTFTEFNAGESDEMYIYNGPTDSGNYYLDVLYGSLTSPVSFTSTHPSGALTVYFSSDADENKSGWKANFSCAVLGVDDAIVKNNTVDIYPNPAKNRITISSKEGLKSYKIYDEAGRLVRSASSLKGNKIEVNLSSIQTGNYVVSIETEKQTINKKLIKQ